MSAQHPQTLIATPRIIRPSLPRGGYRWGLLLLLLLCTCAPALLAQDTARLRRTLAAVDTLFVLQPREALQALREVEAILPHATPKQRTDWLHYHGAAYQRLGMMDSVAYYHRRILATITPEENDKAYARALANLGTAHRARGELDSAAHCYERALEVFEMGTDSFPRGTVRNSLGLIHYARGDYRAAMRVYLEALNLFEGLGHAAAVSIVNNNLGQVYHAQQDYGKAVKHYDAYLQASRASGNRRGEATALNNIGVAYLDRGRPDSAEIYLQQSLVVKEDIGLDAEIATTLNNLGKIAHGRGDYTAALDHHQRGFELARRENNPRDEAFCLIGLGHANQQLGRTAIARTHYRQALKLAEEMGNPQVAFDAHHGLYESYAGESPAQALPHLEAAFDLRDSLLNAENVEALTTLRLENDFRQRELLSEQKVANLELREQLSTARLGNQRRIIIVLLTGLALLAILGYFLWRQRNRIRGQHQVIQQALREKDTLLREIHHRVKNNLQVISSLLGIQSRHVRDEVARQALNEGRSRVQTMALIHENLYGRDRLTGINIREYFDKLLQNLLRTYRIYPERIEVITDIDALVLDVDTLIPLGLILNELMSNALKYAFPTGGGRITVSIREAEGGLRVVVDDDGIGIADPQSVTRGDSYGYELITALVDKLEGELRVSSRPGTTVDILLKEYTLAA
ncbi:two-component sensor histidine kinase/Flp pilus assembly protein TadD [Lewinella aquimaris]|uniref:Two-component sensor histidine kinase/Flp pilus assembly protein TadD n=1 Tax=Neolewinella aquimaris TaxID=1835722 RepID=A0A840ECK9_9BACT|nr:tetratricopeptide repeat protein [Neolewinella aquimaris]MBB4079718.1 two-component sensor histidine kinase/Flp pilus assembly protein TadD [Neolewinella aquimaris]